MDVASAAVIPDTAEVRCHFVRTQITDPEEFLGLLCFGGERCGKKRGGPNQEFPASGSQQAFRPKKDRGKVYSPPALRWTASSNGDSQSMSRTAAFRRTETMRSRRPDVGQC